MATLERRLAALEAIAPSRGRHLIFVSFVGPARLGAEAMTATIGKANGVAIERDAGEAEAAFLARVKAKALADTPESNYVVLVFLYPATAKERNQ